MNQSEIQGALISLREEQEGPDGITQPPNKTLDLPDYEEIIGIQEQRFIEGNSLYSDVFEVNEEMFNSNVQNSTMTNLFI